MYDTTGYFHTAFISPSLTSCSFIPRNVQSTPTSPRRGPAACAEPSKPQQRRRPSRKSSSFENTIDDLTMKRMGRGSIYYGTRENDEAEKQAPDIDDFLKPDPVLVTGGTGRTGQWIALGLVNQGFNVRCFTRVFESAEKIFGPSGSNLDVFEGNVANYEDVYDAVEGSIAIVCASGAQWWMPGGFANTDVKGVQNLVNAAKKAGGVRRFVLISTISERGPRAKAKREAEKIVIESGLAYTIIRVANLSGEGGGLYDIIVSAGEIQNGKGDVSRVDVAQAACQALVYDRTVATLKEETGDDEFEFPNCVINVENGKGPFVPDKRFWKKQFSDITNAVRARDAPGDKVGVEP